MVVLEGGAVSYERGVSVVQPLPWNMFDLPLQRGEFVPTTREMATLGAIGLVLEPLAW